MSNREKVRRKEAGGEKEMDEAKDKTRRRKK